MLIPCVPHRGIHDKEGKEVTFYKVYLDGHRREDLRQVDDGLPGCFAHYIHRTVAVGWKMALWPHLGRHKPEIVADILANVPEMFPSKYNKYQLL